MTAPSQQKLKIQGAVIVTANRLSDGAVVYRAPGGHWSTNLNEAMVVTEEGEARELLASSPDDTIAVGAYVAPVQVALTGLLPGNLRERIRMSGPTFVIPEP